MKPQYPKVYLYSRVSTMMQVDGYSLEAQVNRMRAYANFNNYVIINEYQDAGKSGKSIQGREAFNRMLEDIKSCKDSISYVLVFKLSRFARNAADVLSTLQIMQDYGVNLICVEDGIDSSKDAGKLMISVLSAVAEIERENIRVQTREGKLQKAKEGKWTGGFPPYGYYIENDILKIDKIEAEAIKVIFEKYVKTEMGSYGVAKYLEAHGIKKRPRKNGTAEYFSANLIRKILRNPVYCGKIAFGRRKLEKVKGTRNDFHVKEQKDYLLVNGLHEEIVSEEVWNQAQMKLQVNSKKFEYIRIPSKDRVHLLSGIIKCPICGAGMLGNKSRKKKANGENYKDYFYYGCKHRTVIRGHKCNFNKQIKESLIDNAVIELINKSLLNPTIIDLLTKKINSQIDIEKVQSEILGIKNNIRSLTSSKDNLLKELEKLQVSDKHYDKKYYDISKRIDKIYDTIEDAETKLASYLKKEEILKENRISSKNIVTILSNFDKIFEKMDQREKRNLVECLISEIHIYEQRKANGQWLKSIKFKLPVIKESFEQVLDKQEHVEVVGLLEKRN
ncbi:recombinase family protein [Streptococcus suis]|uniref:recombinase family protein n=1 Tax=Streptococcus suis TaxID=1307 RepID=UPI0005CE7EC1|nr:recombinase family protein [Streptococcus suis]NQM99618.1 recombinase family protein [Streptococcus suis]CYY23727.1 site-specific recombinase [Streptococcus suis]